MFRRSIEPYEYRGDPKNISKTKNPELQLMDLLLSLMG
jgi:hypothetical protein